MHIKPVWNKDKNDRYYNTLLKKTLHELPKK